MELDFPTAPIRTTLFKKILKIHPFKITLVKCPNESIQIINGSIKTSKLYPNVI